MSGLPLLFTAAGPVPTPPATLNTALIALVAAEVPGYTAELPGSLIEDMSSTATGALVTIDQARVDAINNVAPGTANPYILAQLGAQFGIPQGLPANASVLVVFTGTAGFVIPPGFVVSDGTNQYAIQDGGAIATGGTSSPLYAVCTNSNIFAIPVNTVTQIVTSVPSPYNTMTVTNLVAGVPAQSAETIESYQSRLLQAFQVTISGTQAYLKTLLLQVPGVSARLVSVLQNGTNFEILVGGGDPYQVAQAIYAGVSNVGMLAGSATTARNITVSIYDTPNTYSIVFVSPPSQVTTLAIIWNTTLVDFTAGLTFNQLAIPAAYAYLNGIPVGQPINELVLAQIIQAAVAPVMSAANLTTLTFAFTINGSSVVPSTGTSIIPGDPESYFSASLSAITCVQG
jgi:baseplate J-like protein